MPFCSCFYPPRRSRILIQLIRPVALIPMCSSLSSSAASARQNDPMSLLTTSVSHVLSLTSGTLLPRLARDARRTRGGMWPHLSVLAAHPDSLLSTRPAPALPALLTSTPTASVSAATSPAGGTIAPSNARAARPATSTTLLRASVSAPRMLHTSAPTTSAPHATLLAFGILKNFSASAALQA